MTKPGRNDPCPCGSGKKYKKCCLAKDAEAEHQALALAAAERAAPILEPRWPLVPPTWQARSEQYERFHDTDEWEEQDAILRDAIAAGTVDAGEVHHMFSDLFLEAEGSQREKLRRLVEQLRNQAPDLYEENEGSYAAMFLLDVVKAGEIDRLPEMLDAIARHPRENLGNVLETIDILQYWGYADLALQAAHRAWSADEDEGYFDDSAISAALIYLSILEIAASSVPSDTVDASRLQILEQVVDRGLEEYAPHVLALWGRGQRLAPEDFAPSTDRVSLVRNLELLTLGWAGAVSRGGMVTLSRAMLGQRALSMYLMTRLNYGASGLTLLVPHPELLKHLQEQLEDLLLGPSSSEYEVASLVETLPSYVHYLEAHGFIDDDRATAALRDVLFVQQGMLETMRRDGYDESLLHEIERARPTQGVPSTWSPSPAPGFVERIADRGLRLEVDALIRAGEHPDEKILRDILVRGHEVVPILIAIATDLNLLLGESDSPDVWAPMHAARLLGELGATEAIEPLLHLMTWNEEDALDVVVAQALGRMGGAALQPLTRLLQDPTHTDYTRATAGNGLVRLAEYHPDLRDEAIRALVSIVEGPETAFHAESKLVAFVISDLVQMHAVESLPAIREAYRLGLVDEWTVGALSHVEREMGVRPISGERLLIERRSKKRKHKKR